VIRVETSAYGADALSRLTAAVAALKRGDPMAPVTILAPNNIAGIVARRHLAFGLGNGSTGVAAVEITTLPRLAERLASHTLAPRRPATRAINAAAWRSELTDNAGIFAPVADHPATIRALSQAHRELRDLTEDALETLRATTPLTPDLVALHRRVTSRLSSDWYDESTLLEVATQLVSNGTVSTTASILYMPQALTLAEAAFAQAIAESGELVVIAVLTGAQRADEAVHRSLKRLGAATDTKPDIATAHKIINASDSDDEVRCVVREVVEALATNPGHRIAVLYAAASPYARLIDEHFAAAGVTVNGPGVRAVNERAIARTILETLALGDSDFARADVFRTLANAPTRDFGGTRIPLSRWERISRSAGIVRGDDWDERLTTYVHSKTREAEREETDGERLWLAERHRSEAEAASKLQSFVSQLRASVQTADSLTLWTDLAAWATDLFSTLIGDDSELTTLPPEEQYAAVAVRTALAGTSVLDSVDGSPSLDTLREILDLELASALPRVGKFGHGVLVGPISTAIGLNLDVIYLVGLSEDTYPGRLREDALLPEVARAALPGELPSYRESLHARYRALLAAMSSAPKAVAAFPRGDLRRSSQRLPSRFLLPSLRELSGNKALPATEWEHADYGTAMVTSGSFAGELLTTSSIATEQEWRMRAAIAGELEDDSVAAAHDLLDARRGSEFTRFDGNLKGVDGLPSYAHSDRLISPTALESYASCPHAFFVQRLLGVSPLEQPENSVTISPMDVGNLVHESFDELVTEFADSLPGPGQPWSAEQRARLMEIADAKAHAFEDRGLTGHPTLWERERLRITGVLINMLDVDDAWRLRTNTAVRASELPFGLKGVDPIEIIIPSGRVLMRGSADRVDVAADGTIYVTDIKTGSRRAFKEITQDEPTVGGTKMQLPVYAYAAREVFGDRATPVVTAYWFVGRDQGRVELELTPDLESEYADTLDVIVRSMADGLFPAKAPDVPDFAWVQCPYCNPDGVGHGEVRDRWESKRNDPSLRDLVDLIELTSPSSKDDA